MELREVDHHPCQKILAGALGGLAQGTRETQGDMGGGLVDLDRRAQAHHVVEHTLHKAHRAGDGGADNVLALLGIAAVALRVKAGDAAPPGVEGDRRHALGADLLDLNLGIGLTVALTLAVALLGIVLEDADLLALAVFHHRGLHLGAGNGGGADGGVVAVQNRQDLVKDHLIAGLLGQLLDKQGVALSDLVLLTAGNNDCVHTFCTSLSFIMEH